MIHNYEKDINSGYSIVVAATIKPEIKDIYGGALLIEDVEEIDPEIFLSKIKDNFSQANIALLKVYLPKFYRIKLTKFPSEEEIRNIKKSLLEGGNVKRVETYEQTHGEIYSLLKLLEKVSALFTVMVTLISTLLVVKQIEVWRFEHSQRMEIMSLFGAPYWMRSATLFKLAIIDSLFSVVLVAGALFYVQSAPELAGVLDFLGGEGIPFYPGEDIVRLLGLALAISFGSVFFVIFRQKES